MGTDEAAMDFYLKCIEKVNFEDQQKKNADFRDWKRKEGDKLGDPGFRLALRYQLRWLILTLRAVVGKDQGRRTRDRGAGSRRFDLPGCRQARKPQRRHSISRSPPRSFARAYEIGDVDRKSGRLSPDPVGGGLRTGHLPPLPRSVPGSSRCAPLGSSASSRKASRRSPWAATAAAAEKRPDRPPQETIRSDS